MSRESKDELIGELIQLARSSEAAVDAFDEIACQKLGINRTDMRCLNVIDVEGRLTAGRLAERSGLTSAAVTSVLDRLEKAGYARRVRDERDRRQVFVEITPLLHERGAHIWGPIAEEGTKLLRAMPVQALEHVMDYFRLNRELNERHVERLRDLELG